MWETHEGGGREAPTPRPPALTLFLDNLPPMDLDNPTAYVGCGFGHCLLISGVSLLWTPR